MSRISPRWLIGVALVAALAWPLPATDHTTALVYIATLAVAALAASAIRLAVLPAPSLARLRHSWDTPQRLTRQSDPAAAGHTRPRAPSHS